MYVPGFQPSFLGLRGTPEEVSRTAKEFKVYFQLNKKDAGDPRHYLVDHTAGIFVLDAAGKPRVYVSASGRSIDRMLKT